MNTKTYIACCIVHHTLTVATALVCAPVMFVATGVHGLMDFERDVVDILRDQRILIKEKLSAETV